MLIIGCDDHTRFQQIAMLDTETGQIGVGMEATGPAQWFERMLRECGHELWVGDAAKIRASVVRKQKTDSRDALPILDLLLTERFPRIWMASVAGRDARQLLRHRMKLGRFRTSVENQLHAPA